MVTVRYLSMAELEAGLGHITQSPKDNGVLKLIVRRPQEETRESLDAGMLDLDQGLVGDNWQSRGSAGGTKPAQPKAQVTLMNARVIEMLAQDETRWQLAGDQLFLDLDLSQENLPPGTRLALGSAVLEVSDLPHTGCMKFVSRFGMDAMNFVNSPEGRLLNLRGINAWVVHPGLVHVGDTVHKIQPA